MLNSLEYEALIQKNDKTKQNKFHMHLKIVISLVCIKTLKLFNKNVRYI